MKNFIKVVFIVAFLFINANFLPALAEYNPPQYRSEVNDFANILQPNNINIMLNTIRELRAKTGAEIAVVTLPTLDNYPIEDVGLSIARTWQVGQRGKNNGLVIIIAPNERKMRIEVGYGLEGIINDAKAGTVRDNYMLPYFKRGDYNTGILNGTEETAMIIAKANGVTLNGNYTPRPQSSDSTEDFVNFLTIIIFFIFILLRRMPFFFPYFGSSYYNSNSYSSGGGFGGFSGGSFGGGGCSGSW